MIFTSELSKPFKNPEDVNDATKLQPEYKSGTDYICVKNVNSIDTDKKYEKFNLETCSDKDTFESFESSISEAVLRNIPDDRSAKPCLSCNQDFQSLFVKSLSESVKETFNPIENESTDGGSTILSQEYSTHGELLNQSASYPTNISQTVSNNEKDLFLTNLKLSPKRQKPKPASCDTRTYTTINGIQCSIDASAESEELINKKPVVLLERLTTKHLKSFITKDKVKIKSAIGHEMSTSNPIEKINVPNTKSLLYTDSMAVTSPRSSAFTGNENPVDLSGTYPSKSVGMSSEIHGGSSNAPEHIPLCHTIHKNVTNDRIIMSSADQESLDAPSLISMTSEGSEYTKISRAVDDMHCSSFSKDTDRPLPVLVDHSAPHAVILDDGRTQSKSKVLQKTHVDPDPSEVQDKSIRTSEELTMPRLQKEVDNAMPGKNDFIEQAPVLDNSCARNMKMKDSDKQITPNKMREDIKTDIVDIDMRISDRDCDMSLGVDNFMIPRQSGQKSAESDTDINDRDLEFQNMSYEICVSDNTHNVTQFESEYTAQLVSDPSSLDLAEDTTPNQPSLFFVTDPEAQVHDIPQDFSKSRFQIHETLMHNDDSSHSDGDCPRLVIADEINVVNKDSFDSSQSYETMNLVIKDVVSLKDDVDGDEKNLLSDPSDDQQQSNDINKSMGEDALSDLVNDIVDDKNSSLVKEDNDRSDARNIEPVVVAGSVKAPSSQTDAPTLGGREVESDVHSPGASSPPSAQTGCFIQSKTGLLRTDPQHSTKIRLKRKESSRYAIVHNEPDISSPAPNANDDIPLKVAHIRAKLRDNSASSPKFDEIHPSSSKDSGFTVQDEVSRALDTALGSSKPAAQPESIELQERINAEQNTMMNMNRGLTTNPGKASIKSKNNQRPKKSQNEKPSLPLRSIDMSSESNSPSSDINKKEEGGDDLPVILPPKRRRMGAKSKTPERPNARITDDDELLRLTQEFPKYNWLENKIKKNEGGLVAKPEVKSDGVEASTDRNIDVTTVEKNDIETSSLVSSSSTPIVGSPERSVASSSVYTAEKESSNNADTEKLSVNVTRNAEFESLEKPMNMQQRLENMIETSLLAAHNGDDEFEDIKTLAGNNEDVVKKQKPNTPIQRVQPQIKSTVSDMVRDHKDVIANIKTQMQIVQTASEIQQAYNEMNRGVLQKDEIYKAAEALQIPSTPTQSDQAHVSVVTPIVPIDFSSIATNMTQSEDAASLDNPLQHNCIPMPLRTPSPSIRQGTVVHIPSVPPLTMPPPRFPSTTMSGYAGGLRFVETSTGKRLADWNNSGESQNKYVKNDTNSYPAVQKKCSTEIKSPVRNVPLSPQTPRQITTEEYEKMKRDFQRVEMMVAIKERERNQAIMMKHRMAMLLVKMESHLRVAGLKPSTSPLVNEKSYTTPELRDSMPRVEQRDAYSERYRHNQQSCSRHDNIREFGERAYNRRESYDKYPRIPENNLDKSKTVPPPAHGQKPVSLPKEILLEDRYKNNSTFQPLAQKPPDRSPRLVREMMSRTAAIPVNRLSSDTDSFQRNSISNTLLTPPPQGRRSIDTSLYNYTQGKLLEPVPNSSPQGTMQNLSHGYQGDRFQMKDRRDITPRAKSTIEIIDLTRSPGHDNGRLTNKQVPRPVAPQVVYPQNLPAQIKYQPPSISDYNRIQQPIQHPVVTSISHMAASPMQRSPPIRIPPTLIQPTHSETKRQQPPAQDPQDMPVPYRPDMQPNQSRLAPRPVGQFQMNPCPLKSNGNESFHRDAMIRQHQHNRAPISPSSVDVRAHPSLQYQQQQQHIHSHQPHAPQQLMQNVRPAVPAPSDPRKISKQQQSSIPGWPPQPGPYYHNHLPNVQHPNPAAHTQSYDSERFPHPGISDLQYTRRDTPMIPIPSRAPQIRHQQTQNVQHNYLTRQPTPMQVRTEQSNAFQEHTRLCVVCSQRAAFLCSGCKRVWYCSQHCQIKGWQTHRAECSLHA
ncbi:uncharacterized protein LOC141899126 [Tubulanus polymorphus]|uniref:uncharacterized protein LOC141899126 n=1 Tax=Tubulanus polymorphus TaxID=672921 RepID=UPI003DA30A3E